MPRDYHQAVEAMRPGKGGPTAPLPDFIKAYNEDDQVWWTVECGHHQNLFEAAMDLIGYLQTERDHLRDRVKELEQQVAGNFDREMRESAAD
jgi:hypothetical protein